MQTPDKSGLYFVRGSLYLTVKYSSIDVSAYIAVIYDVFLSGLAAREYFRSSYRSATTEFIHIAQFDYIIKPGILNLEIADS